MKKVELETNETEECAPAALKVVTGDDLRVGLPYHAFQYASAYPHCVHAELEVKKCA